ncbi:MAG: cation-translocating P-type ATPase [Anaerolineae bacterium]|nr:cation-translocating P-type ATPase [Anaerolineae bacterium]
MAEQWHQKELSAIEAELNVNAAAGLTAAAAAQLLATAGPNELQEKGRKSPWLILWQQISSIMVLILILAAVVSAFLGKATEAAAIAAIVVLFALLGFVQEYRAEQAMAALKRMSVPVVRARRNGRVTEISARELVPGDVVLLEAGNIVPADLRLAESANLRIQEAALTGESEPVEKETAVLLKADIPLGDRKNMAYMGTNVTYGRGVGIVVETGMNTQLGKIAALIQEVEEGQTPLQQKLDQVGKLLAVLGIVAAALVMLVGVLSGEALDEMFLTAVSVAVAVVPEGLPAVVTITLALGAQRMLRRRALVRKLPAVETLGSVTIICTDKTGTLTENRMTVTVIDVAGHSLELAGTGHTPPVLQTDDAELLLRQPPAIGAALAVGALCNDASLHPDPDSGKYQAVGDPTEGALLVAAAQAHVNLDSLQKEMPRVAELPFDSDRKRMTTVHQLPADRDSLPTAVQPLANHAPYLAFTKGAVDGLMDICDQVWVNGRAEPLDDAWRQRITLANEQMAQNGMRVLGMTFRGLEALPDAHMLPTLENNLIFLGLIGMIDPPRPEVKTAVRTAQTAGIRPIMITGDHPLTARFIAYDLGIATNGRVKTGENLNQMSPAELAEAVADVSVYARVTPEHKLRIVEALQQGGHIVAMTGDGVNDSPALKKADIGVAMGITGTDVAKEASEMVLLDDNFATIVTAVEEGRTIYDNIRRFVKFSIAGNVGKVGVMLFAPLLGMTVALLPLQLLWLNLLTDGLLGLGLGVEPAEKGIMKRPPRAPQASLFSDGLGWHMVWVGCLIAIVGLAIGFFYYDPADQTWQTMIFTTLAFLQIGQALASRSSHASLFSMGLRSNTPLLVLALVTFGLQLMVIYLPALERFFQVDPLTLPELAVCLAAGSLVFVAIEIEKWWLRRGDR